MKMSGVNNLKIIYVISFLDLFAAGIFVPLFAPYLRSLGVSHMTIGFLGSTYSATQFFSGPILGSWSDVRGTKSVLVISLMASCICYILLGLVTSILLIAIVRLMLGCFKHTQTLCRALIATSLSREEQAKAFGFSSALSNAGFILGPILGGYISDKSNGSFYICAATSFIFIINIGLTLLLKEPLKKELNVDTSRPTNFGRRNVAKTILGEFENITTNLKQIDWITYWDAFAVRFLFGVAVSIYFSNQSMYLKETYDLSQTTTGYVLSYVSTLGTITGMVLGHITEKFYKNDGECSKRLLHSLALLTVSFVCMYLASNVNMFLLALIPFGISSIIVRIVSMEYILSKPSKRKGSISGTANSVMSVSRFISPLISGVIGDVFGEQVIMLSAFVPSLIGTLLCLRLHKLQKTKIN